MTKIIKLTKNDKADFEVAPIFHDDEPEILSCYYDGSLYYAEDFSGYYAGSLTVVGADEECDKIEIPGIVEVDGIQKNVGDIDRAAFIGSDIKEVIIHEGLKLIEEEAFCNCRKLTKVRLPDSLEAIHAFAFYGCSSLKQIIIPRNVKYLVIGSFGGCTNLKDIKIMNEELRNHDRIIEDAFEPWCCPPGVEIIDTQKLLLMRNNGNLKTIESRQN